MKKVVVVLLLLVTILSGCANDIVYVDYVYGERINETNVVPDTSFGLVKDLRIEIHKQTCYSWEDIAYLNPLIAPENQYDSCVIDITITNNTGDNLEYDQADFSYTSSGSNEFIATSSLETMDIGIEVDEFGMGELAPYTSTTGSIQVSVPKGTQVEQLKCSNIMYDFTVKLPIANF